jgi:phenylacetate-CoA ligase
MVKISQFITIDILQFKRLLREGKSVRDASEEPSDRELFDPARQSADQDQQRKWAIGGLEENWHRLWESNAIFYKEKYASVGLSADEVPLLVDIPTTSKDELRANEDSYAPFGNYRTVGLPETRFLSTSSGSTGKPMLNMRTSSDQDRWIESMRRHWWRVGIRPGDRLAQTWPPPPYSPPWVMTLAPAEVLEIATGPPVDLTAAISHLNLWKTLQPTAFMTTSSQLALYEEAAATVNLQLVDFTRGTSISIVEAACQFEGPAQWFKDHYGFSRIHNLSGAGDIAGFIGSSCRFNTGTHQSADLVTVEVINPLTGHEAGDGERGHLVVSSLRHDQIWIRYDLEDIVLRQTDACPCGETGPRYLLLGRSADIVRLDGREILPIDVQLALFRIGSPEFRVKGTKNDALYIELETELSAKVLEDELAKVLEVPIKVEILNVGSLPRSTFKPRRSTMTK